jgi:L-lysine exporter family protein LysE/ArgO
MISSLFSGFLLGFSLILAIGAQNTFVLRQGITNQHVFYVALFCAVSDSVLIYIGVSGVSIFFNNDLKYVSNWLFGFSGLWIIAYGLVRLKESFKGNKTLKVNGNSSSNLTRVLMSIAILTFANPHVYLDTMILIGAISQKYIGLNKFAFGFGAILASFVFFFSLAYGARLLQPYMAHPLSWRTLDFITAVIMFLIGFNLLSEAKWIH